MDRIPGTDTARNAYWLKEVSKGYAYKSAVLLKGQDPIDQVTISGAKTYFYAVPVMDQYWRWIGNIVTKWDWGQSQQIQIDRSALDIIGERLPVSIKVNAWSALLSIPLGILVGIWAALKKNKATDNILSTLIMIFISIPSFVLITFLIHILCFSWKILPNMWPDPEADSATKALAYVIPVLSLSFGSIAGYGRITRAELCDVMSSEYLLLARTKGLTKGQAIRRHALRNAMVPIFPSIIANIIGVFTGGSMIVEQLYTIPGTGGLYVQALNSKDWNVLFIIMAFNVSIGLLTGILLDISYGFIDPRIRMGAKK